MGAQGQAEPGGDCRAPDRPRLGCHVRVRRQVVAGAARVLLHVKERSLALGEREWTVLRHADGSRDAEGLRLAAAREGVRVSVEHVLAFVAELAHHGLFDEVPELDEPPEAARDVPLDPLPGYLFRCDGRGQCCIQYDTVLMSPVEVARARATLPLLRDAGVRPEGMFLPEHGLDAPLSVVTRVDGACAYLDAGGRCGLHAAGGPGAKPAGCRIFPAQLIDVGDRIRVAPRPECACVFASAGQREGEPLVHASRGAELPAEVFVPRLPAAVSFGPDELERAALVAFFDGLRPEGDLAIYLWRLADGVATRGRAVDPRQLPALDPAAVRRALAHAAASAARVDALLGCAQRHPRDGVRRGLGWIRAALVRVDPLPVAREPHDEALYLRACFHLVPGARSGVVTELREWAVAMWIARAFPDAARADPAAAHPLAIVEAMARGHGLALVAEP